MQDRSACQVEGAERGRRQANGKVMNYRQFCSQLIDKWDHIWFTRLLDFYKDIHMKRNDLERIAAALQGLIQFASEASGAQRPNTG